VVVPAGAVVVVDDLGAVVVVAGGSVVEAGGSGAVDVVAPEPPGPGPGGMHPVETAASNAMNTGRRRRPRPATGG
jgi:hypothetical protein